MFNLKDRVRTFGGDMSGLVVNLNTFFSSSDGDQLITIEAKDGSHHTFLGSDLTLAD